MAGRRDGGARGPSPGRPGGAAGVESTPELDQALRSARVSLPQGKEIAAAAKANPAAAGQLVAAAQKESFKALRQRCQQVAATVGSAQDEARC